jgi:hypothetical protein
MLRTPGALTSHHEREPFDSHTLQIRRLTIVSSRYNQFPVKINGAQLWMKSGTSAAHVGGLYELHFFV